MRPAGRGDDDPDHELVGARCVGDPDLERLVVRANGVVVLVLDGDVERRAGGAALLGRGKRAPSRRSRRAPCCRSGGCGSPPSRAPRRRRGRRARPCRRLPPARRGARAPARRAAPRAARSSGRSAARDRRRTGRRTGSRRRRPPRPAASGARTGSPPSRSTSSTIVTTLRRPSSATARAYRAPEADNRPVPTLRGRAPRPARDDPGEPGHAPARRPRRAAVPGGRGGPRARRRVDPRGDLRAPPEPARRARGAARRPGRAGRQCPRVRRPRLPRGCSRRTAASRRRS